MIEVTGGRPKVMGRRRAIDAEGPKPGRTPTSVPTKQPTKAAKRLSGSKQMLKAIEKCEKKSTLSSHRYE